MDRLTRSKGRINPSLGLSCRHPGGICPFHGRHDPIVLKGNVSRVALNRLLDPKNTAVTLNTLEPVAAALGKRLRITMQDIVRTSFLVYRHCFEIYIFRAATCRP